MGRGQGEEVINHEQAKRSRRAEYLISGPFSLGDLRWLVEQCKDLPDKATVSVKEHKSHTPTDWDEASIKVTGEMP